MSRNVHFTRREFLGDASAAAAASLIVARTGRAAIMKPEPQKVGISRLRLRTSKVEDLRRFYSQTLGLAVESHAKESITVHAGDTEITFEPSDGEAYYHFAFNIPENMLATSKEWLRSRCPLLKRPDGGDEYHFVSWNAHSVYFNDPAGNILEFIARHTLTNARQGEFASADILYASEIAVVVDDVPTAVRASKLDLGLDVFAGSSSDQFAAVGDDHRLLILVKRGRLWNSGHGRSAEVWPVEAGLRAGRTGRMTLAPFGCDITGGT